MEEIFPHLFSAVESSNEISQTTVVCGGVLVERAFSFIISSLVYDVQEKGAIRDLGGI